ncbi:hypothetical protein GCM10017788_22220 [Amycolatopsis acidiphila]|nr:hypothetical protein GCM10017788_22220 [Amycolatopsis acidiphila]
MLGTKAIESTLVRIEARPLRVPNFFFKAPEGLPALVVTGQGPRTQLTCGALRPLRLRARLRRLIVTATVSQRRVVVNPNVSLDTRGNNFPTVIELPDPGAYRPVTGPV